MWVADMVYNPLYTPFLAGAKNLGINKIITGHELVIEQAMDAFALFIKKPAHRAVMESALHDIIENHN